MRKWHVVNEIRISPDGRVAQLVPPESIKPEQWANGRRWLCMSWPQGQLQAEMLADDQVADWRVLHRDESASDNPQRTDNMAPLSRDLAPDEPEGTGATRG